METGLTENFLACTGLHSPSIQEGRISPQGFDFPGLSSPELFERNTNLSDRTIASIEQEIAEYETAEPLDEFLNLVDSNEMIALTGSLFQKEQAVVTNFLPTVQVASSVFTGKQVRREDVSKPYNTPAERQERREKLREKRSKEVCTSVAEEILELQRRNFQLRFQKCVPSNVVSYPDMEVDEGSDDLLVKLSLQILDGEDEKACIMSDVEYCPIKDQTRVNALRKRISRAEAAKKYRVQKIQIERLQAEFKALSKA
jgi:hypothetical protein